MKLLFENWRNYLNEQHTKRDLEGKTIVLIGDSQMIGQRTWRRANQSASIKHQLSILRRQRNLTQKQRQRQRNLEHWARDHMGKYLENALIARGANVIRLARGGWGSKSWNRNLDPQGLKYLNSLKPDQVIVNLGQNDYKKDPNYFNKYTTPLMQKLKSLNTNVTWFGPSHTTTENESKRKGYETIDTNLRSRADAAGITYVPMLNWIDEDEILTNKNIDQLRYDAAHFRGKTAERWANAINSKITAQKPVQIEPYKSPPEIEPLIRQPIPVTPPPRPPKRTPTPVTEPERP